MFKGLRLLSRYFHVRLYLIGYAIVNHSRKLYDNADDAGAAQCLAVRVCRFLAGCLSARLYHYQNGFLAVERYRLGKC